MPPPRPAREARSGSLEPGRPNRADQPIRAIPAGRPHTPLADQSRLNECTSPNCFRFFFQFHLNYRPLPLEFHNYVYGPTGWWKSLSLHSLQTQYHTMTDRRTEIIERCRALQCWRAIKLHCMTVTEFLHTCLKPYGLLYSSLILS